MLRKYCLRTTLAAALLLLILTSLVGLRIVISKNLSWKIPQEKHVLFLGASHVKRGIDDSITKSGYNMANSSERYLFTYLKLKRLLKDNPQIDQLFLQCAPTDLWEHADDKYFAENEQSLYIPTFFPFFSKEELDVYRDDPIQFCSMIVHSLLDFEYYHPQHNKKLLGGYVRDYKAFKEMNPKEVEHKMMEGKGGNTINRHYLHRIIDLAKSHHVSIHLIYCPVYHPEYVYDQDEFYEAYKKEFSDIELLDYSHWPVADDERIDAHHLNNKGAQRFTKELMKRFHFN